MYKKFKNMKNIHLLPTDKPSKLRYNASNVLVLTEESYKDYSKLDNQNIYITSDEEITGFENNIWVIKGERIFLWQNTMALVSNNKPKKIILTTDPDLIEDGIQAIDDEFLEWFVKNPSCEFVEIERLEDGKYIDRFADGTIKEGIYENYKIIIPQEEPKQETLEEYSNGLYKQSLKDDIDLSFYDGVRLGAKWQQERMYSEVFEWLSSKDYLSDKMAFIQKEFEQFKKK